VSKPLDFTRIYLPRPLDAATVEQLAVRLMAADAPRPVVLEVHASDDGVSHLLGSAPAGLGRLKRLLAGAVPEARFEAAVRPDVAAVGRVVTHPSGLPLAEVDAEQLTANLYEALAARRAGETVAVQLVLGRLYRPTQISGPVLDPLQPLTDRLVQGVRQAPTYTRRRIHSHLGQARLGTTIRIGITAESAKRSRALAWEVFGAFSPLESPGLRLSLSRDSQTRWRNGAASSSGLQLTATDLVGVLGWPIGDRDYPGIRGIHPRLLPTAEIVSRTDSVFAASTSPGPDRPIGIDPKSRLQHLVAIGPTNSGKSTALEHLILSDILAGRACVVIEPKKQLIDSILSRIPAGDAERVVVLDAADVEAPVGFNPLDAGDRDPEVVVDGILAVLAAVFEDGWGPRTEYLIQGALLTLARAGQQAPDPYTLIDLPRLLTDPAFRRGVTSTAAVTADPTLAAFWAEYEEMRPAQRAATIAAPLNKLRKLVLRKHLAAVLGQPRPRFRLRDVFRERKVVLVPLNDALIGTGAAKLLGSLIVAELWMATLERANENDPTRRPGMVFVDEVQNYLHLPTSIGDALATSRSYGVAWHLAHQYREQLPVAMRAAFDANARSKICFALGPDDARDMARMAPQLVAEDFQTLPQYEVYLHLIASGRPVGWCSARTLPPRSVVGEAETIRQASRNNYGSSLTPIRESVVAGSAPKSRATSGPRSTHQKARRS